MTDTREDILSLAACPHCGAEAKHYHRDDGTGWSNTDWISCQGGENCGAQTCLHVTKADAIAAWNRRAAQPSGISSKLTAPAVAVPEGWKFAVKDSDGRTWLHLTTPKGSSAALSCQTMHDRGETIVSQILHYLRDDLAAAPTPPAAEAPGQEPVAVKAAARLGWTYMPSYGEVSFSELVEAVAEATYADRHFTQGGMLEVDPERFIGHQIVPRINFNSLNRIVSAFVRSAFIAAPPTYADAEANGAELVEQLAQWLHDEVEYPDPNFPAHSWPEHPDDTGQRDGGCLKIVPKDTQGQFRDIARRLATFFPVIRSLASSAPKDET